jgi:hypothetical protein
VSERAQEDRNSLMWLGDAEFLAVPRLQRSAAPELCSNRNRYARAALRAGRTNPNAQGATARGPQAGPRGRCSRINRTVSPLNRQNRRRLLGNPVGPASGQAWAISCHSFAARWGVGAAPARACDPAGSRHLAGPSRLPAPQRPGSWRGTANRCTGPMHRFGLKSTVCQPRCGLAKPAARDRPPGRNLRPGRARARLHSPPTGSKRASAGAKW